MMVETRSRTLRETLLVEGVAVLDIECVKVDAPTVWAYRRRFKTVMVGIGIQNGPNFLCVQFGSDDEAELLRAVSDFLIEKGVKRVLFSAARDFDVMVMAGLWTNARRAFAVRPGPWPTLDLRKLCVTENVRRQLKNAVPAVNRDSDIRSVEVLERWPSGDREPVWSHNELDVVELARQNQASFAAANPTTWATF